MLKNTPIRFELAEIKDARFIVDLRSNPKFNRFLSHVSSNIEDQEKWLCDYKKREAAGLEYYFIIKNNNIPCGTIRIYDFQSNSFSWGSWILNENKTFSAALESALFIYQFGFEKKGFRQSHFDVRKENKKVIQFHTKLGARFKNEDQDNIYFLFFREDFEKLKSVFKKYF
jgi:RimJ/RimL family protein N-acetyltransferase